MQNSVRLDTISIKEVVKSGVQFQILIAEMISLTILLDIVNIKQGRS